MARTPSQRSGSSVQVTRTSRFSPSHRLRCPVIAPSPAIAHDCASVPRPSTGQARVALVMPTHGPLGHSTTALAALHRLSPGPDQVIVVSDSQTNPDDANLLPPATTLVHVPFRSGPAFARNRGAQAATTSDVLLFVDSDVVIPPDTIGRIRSIFEASPTLAAAFGSYDDNPGDPGFLSQYRNLLHHYVHQQGCEQASTFWAGLGAIRRDAFLAVGGFDTRYTVPSIEDIELGCRLTAAGHAIRLVKDLQGQHLKRWSATSMLRTDLLSRGIPWTRLLLSRRALTNDLSLDLTARLSTLACGVAFGCLAVAPWFPPIVTVTLASLFLLIVMNCRFYRFLARTRGLWFALRAMPWHALFYFECGLAAFLGTLIHFRCRVSPTATTNP